ncbi:hypothetical protein [Candidatus Binatus sp.]|uniref:hypothetical protein n=1 Tax=Candidatus Binatus sp. TaxID=2811406 RepID=UPI003CC5CF47
MQPRPSRPESTELLRLAAARFRNLTSCERALLINADVNAKSHQELAACGSSSGIDDPSNDPKDAAEWGHQREIRAELIRWLCVDPNAITLIDPEGIALLGARVVGSLNLDLVHPPFGLRLVRCSIPDSMSLQYAELGRLSLRGSYTGEINAAGSHLLHGAFMNLGFHASGEVAFGNSRIDNDLNCSGGSFTHNKAEGTEPWAAEMPALFLGASRIQGPIWLSDGFHANGAVDVNGVTCTDLICSGGRFINPGNLALNALLANVSHAVALNAYGRSGGMEADGLVQFGGAKVGGVFRAMGAKFMGKENEPHGFSAPAISVGEGFFWQNVELQNGAIFNLNDSSVGGLLDDESSWPQPGRLAIDGFTYGDIYAGPTDARSRLRWIKLESRSTLPWFNLEGSFHPQPYRELAKVLRNRGDDAGARQVLIAEERARYAGLSLPLRMWGAFLGVVIGYGYAPLRAVAWSLAVVLIGWAAVSIGKRAGVLRPTWPENRPASTSEPYEELHPLLYSLDVFLPFVNLHQEHYWWPDANASGECVMFGRAIRVRGRTLRYYLWLQVVIGWLLSAIFIAGVSGLISQ